MTREELIKSLLERRADLREKLNKLVERAATETRDLTEDEKTKFEKHDVSIKEIDSRVKDLDKQVRADEAAAEVAKKYTAPARVTSEPEVYRQGPMGRSYLKDLYLARQKNDRDAYDRLERNNKMRADAFRKLAIEQADPYVASAMEERAISTGAGAGGEFVPPLWLENQFVKFVRPGRITANLCRQSPVPPGTNSINIPKVMTGTAVASQVNQNTGIQQTDLTTGSVASPVVTIAGGQTVSLQLIEQSPLNIDDIVLEDLAADYAQKLNIQVISGSGTGGTLTGLTTLAGTQSVAWTQASPALGGAGGLYSKVANGIQLVHTTRFLPPTAILMAPRRWAWAESQSDSTGRPLVVPDSSAPFNAMGNMDAQDSQGYAGRMLRLPVYEDATIPLTLGAGTNQDEVIVARMSDLWLWEGQVRAEAFQQTYAQNMSVFVRLYNYASFQAGRYPQSIALITGTGAVPPTF